jgi:aminopeptidase N
VQTGQPWFDEGLAQFASLLWIEQTEGRPAAILQLNNLIQPLNIAEVGFDSEPASASAPSGQPLVSATDELYYRRKAAAVWWMLRGIAGDNALQQALTQWRKQSSQSTGAFSRDDPTVQAIAFEKLLEKTSGKDLGWFFSDWVLRDRGLPDLSIVDVEPRLLPAGKGHDAGWLVSVTVHNDGAPTVDVPLTVLSATFTTTTRLRIPGFSNVSTRVIVEAPPTEVILNDGSTPEVRAATHTREVILQPATTF